MPGVPWRRRADGIDLALRVTPNAARNAIGPIEPRPDGPALRVRITAPPDRGRANKAVLALLAKALAVPKSAVAITAGDTARDKTVAVTGNPEALITRLRALVA